MVLVSIMVLYRNSHFREQGKVGGGGGDQRLPFNLGVSTNLLTSLIKQENFVCCKKLERRYQLGFVMEKSEHFLNNV